MGGAYQAAGKAKCRDKCSLGGADSFAAIPIERALIVRPEYNFEIQPEVKTAPKKSQALTVKQLKFVKEYVKRKGNGSAAAMAVYDAKTRATAGAIASENLKKPNVAQSVREEMARQGLTMEAIVQPVAKAIVAQKQIVNEKTGEVLFETDDLELQLKGHDRAMKMLNFGEDKGGQTNNFNFVGGELKISFHSYAKKEDDAGRD